MEKENYLVHKINGLQDFYLMKINTPEKNFSCIYRNYTELLFGFTEKVEEFKPSSSAVLNLDMLEKREEGLVKKIFEFYQENGKGCGGNCRCNE